MDASGSLAVEQLAQAQRRFGRLPIQLDGFAELGERLIDGALFPQDRADHVMGLRIFGLAIEGSAERRERFNSPPRLPQHYPQRKVSFGEAGIELRGPGQRCLRTREIIALLEGEPQVVERFCVVGAASRQVPVNVNG